MFDSISQLGRKRSNPKANINNALYLVKNCGCTNDPVCEDVITISAFTAGIMLNGITFEGTPYTFPSPLSLETQQWEIMCEILKIISTDYSENDRPYRYETTAKEAHPGLTIETVGADIVIKHTGACTISAISLSTGDTVTVARNCTLVNACAYQLEGMGTIGPITVNGGAPQALANDPYAFAGVPATDDATALLLEADLQAALVAGGATVYNVTVTPDATRGLFVMKIWIAEATVNAQGVGMDFADCGCEERFVA